MFHSALIGWMSRSHTTILQFVLQSTERTGVQLDLVIRELENDNDGPLLYSSTGSAAINYCRYQVTGPIH